MLETRRQELEESLYQLTQEREKFEETLYQTKKQEEPLLAYLEKLQETLTTSHDRFHLRTDWLPDMNRFKGQIEENLSELRRMHRRTEAELEAKQTNLKQAIHRLDNWEDWL